MGDMGEIFQAMREASKERRAKRKLKYTGKLIAIGAEPKSDSVWQHNDWFLYPSKGFVMNRFNSMQRMSLDKYLERYRNEQL